MKTMARSLYVGMAATILFMSVASSQAADADVVIVANGNILTMNPDQPTASAMVVKKGKILKVAGRSIDW